METESIPDINRISKLSNRYDDPNPTRKKEKVVHKAIVKPDIQPSEKPKERPPLRSVKKPLPTPVHMPEPQSDVGEYELDTPELAPEKITDTPDKAKPKKSSDLSREEIIEKASLSLEGITCNVLTGECLACEEVETCKEATGNFTKISNALPYHLLPILSGNAFKLYLYFSGRSGGNPKDGNYGKCWPGNETIMSDTGVHKKNIWMYLAELEGLNLINVFYTNEGGKNKKRFIYVTWFNKVRNIESRRKKK